MRTAVLFPVLTRAGVSWRDRRLIAFFGPRGLSSLLLVLLPVFAGLPGAERLFTIVCLVVLISVAVHGVGIAFLLRANVSRARLAVPEPQPTPTPDAGVPDVAQLEAGVPERIGIDELRSLWARGAPVTIVDSRTERAWDADDIQARGAVRIPPDDPVRSAKALRLARNATLVVYCA
jgi:hypothetical protein